MSDVIHSLTYDQLVQLTTAHGPCFYIVDLDQFRRNLKQFRQAFAQHYDNVRLAYSFKTNYLPDLCNTARNENVLAEVVSPLEYDLAIRLGFPAKEIIFNGPAKPEAYLRSATEAGAIVNLDSVEEFDYLDSLSQQDGRKINIGLRCCVGRQPQSSSRFGISVVNGDIQQVARRIHDNPNLQLIALHTHFSGGRDAAEYADRTNGLCDVLEMFPSQPIEWLDIGGGFFGEMPESMARQFASRPATLEEYAAAVGDVLNTRLTDRRPQLVLEPGVAVVANTMSFVCRVESVKQAPDRQIANTTGSVQNIKPTKSKFNLPLHIVASAGTSDTDQSRLPTDICGYTCMEDDVLYHGLEHKVARGDYLVIGHTGAYSLVFKPPFIRPSPAILIWESAEDSLKVARRAESLDDWLATSCLPAREG